MGSICELSSSGLSTDVVCSISLENRALQCVIYVVKGSTLMQIIFFCNTNHYGINDDQKQHKIFGNSNVIIKCKSERKGLQDQAVTPAMMYGLKMAALTKRLEAKLQIKVLKKIRCSLGVRNSIKGEFWGLCGLQSDMQLCSNCHAV